MAESVHTAVVTIPDPVQPVEICGPADRILRALEHHFPGVSVHARSNEVIIEGSVGDVSMIKDFLTELTELAASGKGLSPEVIEQAIATMGHTSPFHKRPARKKSARPGVFQRGEVTVRAKTPGQQDYVDAIDRSTIVFGIGPAGTGKTYLAMAKAVAALFAGDVKRIILTRPAVEAGERLGYLPGTLTEKIDPYLRPLYDALHEMVGPEDLPTLMDSGVIEVAPLAYMRGRTLNDAFIVLDEAQNTTAQQMKMFLTRLGFNSTMVVTGDISQIDLPGGARSGLKMVQHILNGIEDIEFCYLTSADVVRHELVGRIIDAYDAWEVEQEAQGRPRKKKH